MEERGRLVMMGGVGDGYLQKKNRGENRRDGIFSPHSLFLSIPSRGKQVQLIGFEPNPRGNLEFHTAGCGHAVERGVWRLRLYEGRGMDWDGYFKEGNRRWVH